MVTQRRLTEKDGRLALRDHAVAKAEEARRKFGGTVGYEQILRLLEDPELVRFPTRLCFDAEPLRHDEFAWAECQGDKISDGYCLWVHPSFEGREDVLPLLIAYHIPSMIYGEVVTEEEAELYGATLLGLEVEDYYQRLCDLADGVGTFEV